MGRSPSSYGHWDGESLCRSIYFHSSFEPVPQHYTTHSGWGKSHLNPTSLIDCAWTSSTNGRGIHLNHSWNGASSVTLITCLVKWVQPSSQGSKEKMLQACGFHQLCWPRSQANQTASPAPVLWSALSLNALGLIQCIYHVRLHLQLRHLIGSYYYCHWDLLLQSLRVHRTISHYNGNTLAAIAHLCVSILYHQT